MANGGNNVVVRNLCLQTPGGHVRATVFFDGALFSSWVLHLSRHAITTHMSITLTYAPGGFAERHNDLCGPNIRLIACPLRAPLFERFT